MEEKTAQSKLAVGMANVDRPDSILDLRSGRTKCYCGGTSGRGSPLSMPQNHLQWKLFIYQGIWATPHELFSPQNPASPHNSPDTCVLFTSHCIPRDAKVISPHFWGCEESIPSHSEYPIFNPSSQSLIYIPFYAPPQPLSPPNYGRERDPFNTNSSPNVSCLTRISESRIAKILCLASCSVLLAFRWIAVGVRTALWHQEVLAQGTLSQLLLLSRFHLIYVILSYVMRQYDGSIHVFNGNK